MTLILTRSDVERLLDPRTCIRAVDDAFRMRGTGGRIESAVLGLHAEHGGMHVKAAAMLGERSYFAAKLNANFPRNPATFGLPTIQGMLGLFDATNGVPLLIMDSIAITLLRTAAATGVAAKYLSRDDAETVAIIGCGAQAIHQLEALSAVRPVRSIRAIDSNVDAAKALTRLAGERLSVDASVARDLDTAVAGADIVVTCTPARQAFLQSRHVRPGTFVAAVGADNEEKSEIDPALMAAAVVVCDDVGQCATIGDLHHAMAAGAMQASDIHAELHEIVAGTAARSDVEDEVVIFDSTGVALEDVASAAIVYERACAEGVGQAIDLGR